MTTSLAPSPELQALAVEIDQQIEERLVGRHLNTSITQSIVDESVPDLTAHFNIWHGQGDIPIAFRPRYTVTAHDPHRDRYGQRSNWGSVFINPPHIPNGGNVAWSFTRHENRDDKDAAKAALLARYERFAALPTPLASVALASFKPLIAANKREYNSDVKVPSPHQWRVARTVRKLREYATEHPELVSSYRADTMFTLTPDGRHATLSRTVNTHGDNPEPTSAAFRMVVTDPDKGISETYSHREGYTGSQIEYTWYAAGFSGESTTIDKIQGVAELALAGKTIRR